jgi:hypothetical protein
VIEDVKRLGGFGIAAHPDSRKQALQWHEWTAPFDGLEWLNADSEWRDVDRRRLARALVTYPFRPVETLGSMLDRPDVTMARWDALTRGGGWWAWQGPTAHAPRRLAGQRRAGLSPGFLRIPSYATSFRMYALRVNLERPLSPLNNDAPADANSLLQALRAGHVYHRHRRHRIAGGARFFRHEQHRRTAEQGDRLEPGSPITFRARVNAPAGGQSHCARTGKSWRSVPCPELSFERLAGPGVYRVEV